LDGDPGPARWAELNATFGEGSFTAAVGIEEALLAALAPPETASAAPASAGETSPAGGSKTFDLLLDVELPVSVSFGRAQIPLRDVIKLTTGSIVELNRSISEPVEIIVNNCVIARGEVVVVEGNFGVRIQEVISRQERLRTLQ
jgi:flagellar motor switch protein FliN/FliY